MSARRLVSACVATLALSACDDPSTSGRIVEPLVGPRIAESQLALAVVDGAPAGITDIFETADIVHLWVHWIALEPPHDVEIVWWDPNDNNYPTTLQLTENAVEQVTVFTLEFAAMSPTGRWEVEIFLDGEFMRSHIFLVSDSI